MRIKFELNNLFYKIIIICATIDVSIGQILINEQIKDKLHNIFLIFIILASILDVIVKKYSIKGLLLNLSLLIFGIYSYYVSGNTGLLLTLIIVALSINVNIESVLRIIYIIRIIVFSGTIICSIFGLLPIGDLFIESGEKGILLGYGHSNTFAGTAGIIILLMLTINRKNLRLRHYLSALIIEIFVFIVSRARISLLIIPLVIILILILQNSKRRDRWFKFCGYLFPIILIINFSAVALKLLNIANNITAFLDSITNSRITLAAMNLMYYPLSIFGQKIDISIIANKNQYYALDNGYTYLLIHYGIVGLLIFCALFEMSMIMCKVNDEYILSIIVFAFMIWSVYEAMMITATSNFSLIFSVYFLITKNKVIRYRREKNDT